MTETTPADQGLIEASARVTLFGFDASEATAVIQRRPKRWRLGGAARTMGVFLVVAPLVAIVPPHAPWGIGALATGVILARRRLVERFTLIRLHGVCPNCSEALSVKSARLRTPHPIICEGCHHESSLRVPAEYLESSSRDTL